jgi:uncharacterized protein (UPF0335 family)
MTKGVEILREPTRKLTKNAKKTRKIVRKRKKDAAARAETRYVTL